MSLLPLLSLAALLLIEFTGKVDLRPASMGGWGVVAWTEVIQIWWTHTVSFLIDSVRDTRRALLTEPYLAVALHLSRNWHGRYFFWSLTLTNALRSLHLLLAESVLVDVINAGSHELLHALVRVFGCVRLLPVGFAFFRLLVDVILLLVRAVLRLWMGRSSVQALVKIHVSVVLWLILLFELDQLTVMKLFSLSARCRLDNLNYIILIWIDFNLQAFAKVELLTCRLWVLPSFWWTFIYILLLRAFWVLLIFEILWLVLRVIGHIYVLSAWCHLFSGGIFLTIIALAAILVILEGTRTCFVVSLRLAEGSLLRVRLVGSGWRARSCITSCSSVFFLIEAAWTRLVGGLGDQLASAGSAILLRRLHIWKWEACPLVAARRFCRRCRIWRIIGLTVRFRWVWELHYLLLIFYLDTLRPWLHVFVSVFYECTWLFDHVVEAVLRDCGLLTLLLIWI